MFSCIFIYFKKNKSNKQNYLLLALNPHLSHFSNISTQDKQKKSVLHICDL